MISISHETIDGIPTLHVVKEEKKQQLVPTVFFLHGFTSGKEHNLHYAYHLANEGIRVILPDALHHGERQSSLNGRELYYAFWDIVTTSVEELNGMKKSLQQRGLIDEEHLGLIGTSMGGITLFGAIQKYTWVKAAASMMGCAYYEDFAKRQIASLEKSGAVVSGEEKKRVVSQIRSYELMKKDIFERVPLYLWHGMKDEVVPYHYSEALYNEAKQLGVDSHITFRADETADHKVSREGLLESVDWMRTQLSTRSSLSKA